MKPVAEEEVEFGLSHPFNHPTVNIMTLSFLEIANASTSANKSEYHPIGGTRNFWIENLQLKMDRAKGLKRVTESSQTKPSSHFHRHNQPNDFRGTNPLDLTEIDGQIETPMKSQNKGNFLPPFPKSTKPSELPWCVSKSRRHLTSKEKRRETSAVC